MANEFTISKIVSKILNMVKAIIYKSIIIIYFKLIIKIRKFFYAQYFFSSRHFLRTLISKLPFVKIH